MDKEKVLDYVMNSPGNSNRAVLSGMLDESGGGNSDFSTATITLENGSFSYITNACLASQVYGIEENPIEASFPTGVVSNGEIILYKGKAIIMLDSGAVSHISELSGGIEALNMPNNYLVTGDCTITFQY